MAATAHRVIAGAPTTTSNADRRQGQHAEDDRGAPDRPHPDEVQPGQDDDEGEGPQPALARPISGRQ